MTVRGISSSLLLVATNIRDNLVPSPLIGMVSAKFTSELVSCLKCISCRVDVINLHANSSALVGVGMIPLTLTMRSF